MKTTVIAGASVGLFASLPALAPMGAALLMLVLVLLAVVVVLLLPATVLLGIELVRGQRRRYVQAAAVGWP